VTEKILYHTEKIEEIPDICVQSIIKGKFSHILFYSKRTAENFVSAMQNHTDFESLKEGLKMTQALCLGESMVQCLSVLSWQNVKVATEPNQESLLALFD
jgi:uroporphyrinogen-III synthase